MKDKLVVAGVLVALVLGVMGVVGSGGVDGRDGQNGKDGFGAVSGPKVDFPFWEVNGVAHHYYSSGLNQASTTVCSFRSPRSATSTLLFASLQLTTGTTTDTFWEFGKDASFAATTTRIE